MAGNVFRFDPAVQIGAKGLALFMAAGAAYVFTGARVQDPTVYARAAPAVRLPALCIIPLAPSTSYAPPLIDAAYRRDAVATGFVWQGSVALFPPTVAFVPAVGVTQPYVRDDARAVLTASRALPPPAEALPPFTWIAQAAYLRDDVRARQPDPRAPLASSDWLAGQSPNALAAYYREPVATRPVPTYPLYPAPDFVLYVPPSAQNAYLREPPATRTIPPQLAGLFTPPGALYLFTGPTLQAIAAYPYPSPLDARREWRPLLPPTPNVYDEPPVITPPEPPPPSTTPSGGGGERPKKYDPRKDHRAAPGGKGRITQSIELGQANDPTRELAQHLQSANKARIEQELETANAKVAKAQAKVDSADAAKVKRLEAELAKRTAERDQLLARLDSIDVQLHNIAAMQWLLLII